MYARTGRVKAKLETWDGKNPKASVDFQFNSSELEVTRGSGFSSEGSKDGAARDYGGVKFTGGKSDELSMTFTLDTTEKDIFDSGYAAVMMSPIISSLAATDPAKSAVGNPLFAGAVNTHSVTGIIGEITTMTKLSKEALDSQKSGKAEPIYPRLVQFTWGDLKFSGVIEKFSFKLTLFDSDGTPKRAEVTLGLTGVYGDYVGKPEDLLFAQGESKAETEQSF